MQIRQQTAQSQAIPSGAETGDLGNDHRCDMRAAAERFTGMDIGKMNFNCRQGDRGNGIAQSDTGMRIGTWIDQNARCSIASRGMNPVDQGSFMVGLKRFDRDPEFGTKLYQAPINIGESCSTVNFRLARAEQVQVRSMQYEN